MHARSAFRDEGIEVQNNMPFFDEERVFIFNGELRGVRIKADGRIGAEKIFNFVKRFDKGDMHTALRRGVDVIRKRSRYVRAMNIILASPEQVHVSSTFGEDPDYFQMRYRQTQEELIVCPIRWMSATTGSYSPTLTHRVLIDGYRKDRGGADINLAGAIADIAELSEPCVIVHGANALRDQLAEQLGTPKQVVTSTSGYSSVLSDANAIDVILMSYAGLRNKRVVELCQRNGVNAVGLTGIDGQTVKGERNKGIRVRENNKNLIKRDFSGKARSVNGDLLRLLLDNGYTPVITIPIVDEKGYAVNSENDDIVNALQAALHADTIVQLIEAPGFLDDANDTNSLVPSMTRAEVAVREQQVEGRMKRKMLALKTLVQLDQVRVVISDGCVEHPVRDALAGAGTTIQ